MMRLSAKGHTYAEVVRSSFRAVRHQPKHTRGSQGDSYQSKDQKQLGQEFFLSQRASHMLV